MTTQIAYDKYGIKYVSFDNGPCFKISWDNIILGHSMSINYYPDIIPIFESDTCISQYKYITQKCTLDKYLTRRQKREINDSIEWAFELTKKSHSNTKLMYKLAYNATETMKEIAPVEEIMSMLCQEIVS